MGIISPEFFSDFDLPQSLKLALELILNNIDEPLTVGEIATCVCISRRHLERQFCHHVNAALSRYYLESRLTRARPRLLQTTKFLADIAVACGLSAFRIFGAAFASSSA